MRVALLTSANGWRGSGVSYAKLARGLADRGHVAQLVTARPRLTRRLVEEGFDVTEIPGRDTGPREVLALRRVLAKIGAEAIVTDTPRDIRLSVYATLLHRAHIVYRYNLNYRRPRTHLMDRVYLSRVAACVYQSRYIRDDAIGHARWMARIRAYHVPNGYDVQRHAPNVDAGRAFRAVYGIAPETRVVLSAAKLTRNKGHDVAIAALSRVRRAGTELLYVVCGDGQLEGELLALAHREGLPVLFTGLLTTEDMIGAYNAADLVVHPSLQEIFPNAVGEAMSCGRPVVAADAGGTGELLGRDGAAGVLVPASDVEALRDAVGALLRDDGRRRALGAAARSRVETEFPVARMIDGYERALEEVVGSGA
ncbi:MAG TPA: glycosyltransferase family 4 protein [Gemmatimonadales bacterium]|nr:glycosyltransferase family 4 protein [Gemmatimonadales bacterium]